ncbi:MAG: DUF3737 family protein [Fibrobacter sp.]|nr:DUF3737 family protein [Fibrobacter sp.]
MQSDVKQAFFAEERALYQSRNIKISDSVFEDGESPLKESKDIKVTDSIFKWRYPFWYCENIEIKNTDFLENTRAGMWYTHHISIENAMISSPKNFRRCNDVTMKNVRFTNGDETLWDCRDVKLCDVYSKGDYFAMNSSDMTIENFSLDGKYSFDGVKNTIVKNSRMLTKDAFWNSENVTVYDSYIIGEYLGWNSKNLTFINCTLESLQGLCYAENLVLKNCKLLNTTLAFEYSSVDAEIITTIDSVKNPSKGVIRSLGIKELVLEKDKVDVNLTQFENI